MPAIRTLILMLTLALTGLSSACATSTGAQGGADGWNAPTWETALVEVNFNGCVDRCSPLQDAKSSLGERVGGAIEVRDVRTVSRGYVIVYRVLP